MKIQVKTPSGVVLTYEAPSGTQVGDIASVHVNTFWKSPYGETVDAEVVELGSDYSGPLKRVNNITRYNSRMKEEV